MSTTVTATTLAHHHQRGGSAVEIMPAIGPAIALHPVPHAAGDAEGQQPQQHDGNQQHADLTHYRTR